MTRCPNGSRKIIPKIGKCVKTKKNKLKITDYFPITSFAKNNTRSKASHQLTPRTKYQKKYFNSKKKSKKIKLLGESYPVDADRILFQVSFSNKEQFKEYAGLSKDPKIDCFFQTLFSLGLRNLSLLKKDSENVNIYGKQGVKPAKAAKFIACSFGLENSDVVGFERGFAYNNETTKTIISERMDTWLVNNHATILCLGFLEKDEKNNDVDDVKHYIIAYKYNDEVFYFDPQKQIENKNILNIVPKTQKGHQVHIKSLSFFAVKNVSKSVVLLKKKCEIPYYG